MSWMQLFQLDKSDFQGIVALITGKQSLDKNLLEKTTDNRVEIKYGTCGVNMPKEVWDRLKV